jgi:ATP-dependent RNA helicase SUPV3L1/SUV3
LLAEFAAGTPADAAPAANAETPPAEPAMIDIWRPGRAEHRRPERRPKPEPRAEGGKRPPRKREGKSFKGKPRPNQGKDQKRRPPERRERPADPNSPFAALAGLKAQLESDKPKT